MFEGSSRASRVGYRAHVGFWRGDEMRLTLIETTAKADVRTYYLRILGFGEAYHNEGVCFVQQQAKLIQTSWDSQQQPI
jgi:hypothetical protein